VHIWIKIRVKNCILLCAKMRTTHAHTSLALPAMRGGEYKKCNKSPVINVWDTRAYYIKCGRRKMCILGPSCIDARVRCKKFKLWRACVCVWYTYRVLLVCQSIFPTLLNKRLCPYACWRDQVGALLFHLE
jgi:hypothetical protein